MRHVLPNIAAALLLYLAIVTTTFIMLREAWAFSKSPNTGICYEMRSGLALLGAYEAMSPVDPSYCEETTE